MTATGNKHYSNFREREKQSTEKGLQGCSCSNVKQKRSGKPRRLSMSRSTIVVLFCLVFYYFADLWKLDHWEMVQQWEK